MATMTVEQIKAAAQAELKTVQELRSYLVKSLPLRATGGGHLFNQLGTVEATLAKLADVTVEAEEVPAP